MAYAVIQFLKTFTVVVVMTKGGPAGATNFISYARCTSCSTNRTMGRPTAMATVLFLIVMLAGLGAFWLVERIRA